MFPTILWKGRELTCYIFLQNELLLSLLITVRASGSEVQHHNYGSMRCERGDQFTHCQEQTNTFR